MPVYNDVPPINYYPNPELFVRKLCEPLNIRSILDVGAGHGGVFDHGYWTAREMDRREACDIYWMRDCGPGWNLRSGVDACELSKHYPENSFDLVLCMEVLEHIPNSRKALEEMCKVARKMVMISSADEDHHKGEAQERIEKFNKYQAYVLQPKISDLRELGFNTHVEHFERKQIVAWKIK